MIDLTTNTSNIAGLVFSEIEAIRTGFGNNAVICGPCINAVEGNDQMTRCNGNDTLNGFAVFGSGRGDEIMSGGVESDTCWTATAATIVAQIVNEGIVTLFTTLTVNLCPNIENLATFCAGQGQLCGQRPEQRDHRVERERHRNRLHRR